MAVKRSNGGFDFFRGKIFDCWAFTLVGVGVTLVLVSLGWNTSSRWVAKVFVFFFRHGVPSYQ